MRSAIVAILLLMLYGCGPVTGIGKIGWYLRYDMSHADLYNPESIYKLAEALEDINPKVKLEAIVNINRHGLKSRPVMDKMAKQAFLSGNRTVTKYAMTSLAMIGYEPFQVIPSMQKALIDENDNFRKNALNFYKAKMMYDSDYNELLPYIEPLRDDERGSVKGLAIEVLDALQNAEKAPFEINGIAIKASRQGVYYNGFTHVNLSRTGVTALTLQIANKTEAPFSISPKNVEVVDSLGSKRRLLSPYDAFMTMDKPYISIRGVRANSAIKNTLSNDMLYNIVVAPGQKIKKTVFFNSPPNSDLKNWKIKITTIDSQDQKIEADVVL